MKKDNNKLTILTTIVCLVPIIAGIALYKNLPDPMITHWDFQGNPNGYMPKNIAIIALPGLLAVLNIFVPFLLKMDPKYDNMNRQMKNLVYWIIPVVSIFCASTTLAVGLGYESRLSVTAPLFIGLLFIVIGNYLPKTNQTYTVGIKLPWTLHDEENWNKTHRLAGFVWVICGFLLMVSVFLPAMPVIACILLAIMILVPTVYSYLLYRKSSKSAEE